MHRRAETFPTDLMRIVPPKIVSSIQNIWRLTILAVVMASATCTTSAQESPDVLLISIDDLNDWVGVLGGHPQALTPNIDRLAGRGMVFTNAHASAPLCNPSRTSLMSGLRPSTTGVYGSGPDWRKLEIFEDIPTLPRFFRESGYQTMGGGKLFHAHTILPQGFFGFNDPNAWDTYYPSIERQLPDEVGPAVRPANGNPGFLGFDWSSVVAEDSAMGDGQVTESAVNQISTPTPGPRFIGVGIYRPHLPWYIPQKYLDMHPLEDIILPPTIENDLDDVPEIGRFRSTRTDDIYEWVLEQGVWDETVQAYLASSTFADAMVGRVIEALDNSGRADHTIIVLFSDHGHHLGEKRRWSKQTLWEDVTRVPLIVVAPGVTTPGSRTGRPVSLLDIYPTLTELAGLPAPGHLEGASLMPLLRDPDAEWNNAAVTTKSYMEHSVRGNRYRYIRHSDGTEEVYDLESDPNEWTNLANDPAVSDVIRALSNWLPEVNVRLN